MRRWLAGIIVFFGMIVGMGLRLGLWLRLILIRRGCLVLRLCRRLVDSRRMHSLIGRRGFVLCFDLPLGRRRRNAFFRSNVFGLHHALRDRGGLHRRRMPQRGGRVGFWRRRSCRQGASAIGRRELPTITRGSLDMGLLRGGRLDMPLA